MSYSLTLSRKSTGAVKERIWRSPCSETITVQSCYYLNNYAGVGKPSGENLKKLWGTRKSSTFKQCNPLKQQEQQHHDNTNNNTNTKTQHGNCIKQSRKNNLLNSRFQDFLCNCNKYCMFSISRPVSQFWYFLYPIIPLFEKKTLVNIDCIFVACIKHCSCRGKPLYLDNFTFIFFAFWFAVLQGKEQF